jgi:DNA repair photolyase
VRGDGLLKFYQYERQGRTNGNQYQFRLAMADGEALTRAGQYLFDLAVPTVRFVFQRATPTHRPLEAIRTHSRGGVEAIERIVGWPASSSLEWCKGFLAGIFDAEGGYSDGILRISNTNPLIVNCMERCFERLGFSVVPEFRAKMGLKPIAVLRIRGGLREHLRFFHAADPAITRKRDIEGQAIKNDSQLGVVAIESVGVSRLFDITTGTGDFIANGVVSHNCYARRTHWFMDEDGVDGWSSKIFVKANAPQVLRQELGRPAWKRELVALGTATDPYQPIEGHYRITRRILEALRDFRTPVSIVTRSPLILRDIDILTDMARRVEVTICVSIATTDPDLAHQIEPTVAPPAQRLRTVERLAGSGVRTGVLLAPVLPGLTDGHESLAAVIEAAGEAGASFVGHRVLYLGDVTKDAFLQFLAARYPDLLPRYRQMYRGQYAPAAYERHVKRVVDLEKERTAKPFAPRYLRPPEEPQQLELF